MDGCFPIALDIQALSQRTFLITHFVVLTFSRNREGMCTVNGKSVIVEVSSLTGLATYITELAASLFGSISETPFELVPVLITSTDSSQTIHSEKPSNLVPLTTHHDTAATPSLGMYYDY